MSAFNQLLFLECLANPEPLIDPSYCQEGVNPTNVQ